MFIVRLICSSNVHCQTNLLAGYGSMLKHMVSFTNDFSYNDLALVTNNIHSVLYKNGTQQQQKHKQDT